jgi:hypothetical protein
VAYKTNKTQLNGFNDAVGLLLEVYRIWQDQEGSKDEVLADLWDILKELPGAVSDLEKQLAGKLVLRTGGCKPNRLSEHRTKGAGGRFHLRRGFLLNLPYAYFRYAVSPLVHDHDDREITELSVDLADALAVLSRYHSDASRCFSRYRTTPGEVSDEEREEWMIEEGWTKRPHWIARVIAIDEE